ncbi:MAG: GNAT family N-acetyltransferase [Pseudomonadota bacterium]
MAPYIETVRLILRPYRETDRAALVDILGRCDVSKWLSKVPYPFGAADVRITCEDGSSRWPETMGIERDGELIGAVSGGAHVGYFLHPEAWGQGIATEATHAVVQFHFENTDIDAQHSDVFHGNDASRRVLEKAGFQPAGEGEVYCRAQDVKVPHTEYVLTRADWEAMH